MDIAPDPATRLLEGLAAELAGAAEDRWPVPTLVGRYPQLTLEDAYRIQQINVERRLARGARVVGHKVGLTSPAMQQQMGIYEPDSGVVFDDMLAESGCRLRAGDFLCPRIETEIAFRLGSDLDCPADLATVRGAVAEVFLAFEVLDVSYTSWNITLVDSVADNAACARAVLGPPVLFDQAADLGAEQIIFSINGTTWASGEGRDILGDPLAALVWLSHRLALTGSALCAGDIVLAGSVHASIPLFPGMSLRATSTGLPAVDLHTV